MKCPVCFSKDIIINDEYIRGCMTGKKKGQCKLCCHRWTFKLKKEQEK